jgi:hypothetical protein
MTDMPRLIATLIVGWLCTATAAAGEACRYAGTTDYDGRVAITTDASTENGITNVDVLVTFRAVTGFWLPVRYLIEEISTWRAGELQSVSANYRYLLAGHIMRQQWDDFQRGPGGMQARRVQGKTLGDFRLKHPGFVEHWDPATFGQPWLQDYASAPPERRADLDLASPTLPSGLRSPLAMAFYWVRWLPRGGADVPVFLPGFKTDRVAQLHITGAGADGGMMWQTPLRYPAFSDTPASSATAWTSPDHRLLRLSFELHGSRGSARGLIQQQGCEGTPASGGR